MKLINMRCEQYFGTDIMFWELFHHYILQCGFEMIFACFDFNILKLVMRIDVYMLEKTTRHYFQCI